MRTFGVEEELLLVDPATACPIPAARSVVDAAAILASGLGAVTVTTEMQQEMVEAVSTPQHDLEGLARAVRDGRRIADDAARTAGARAVALAASPVACTPHPTPAERYDTMMRRYGQTARTSLACGMHVHVSIASPDEGVQVLDRIRPWLAVIVGLSSNSSVANGIDTGHASHRTLEWYRWPCAGPYDVFGSLEAYLHYEDSLLGSGVLLDSGMLYLDARLSRNHPTVEIRVADVCSDRNHALAIASLVRALVETAAREADSGIRPSDMPSTFLRLASWQAALTGVQGPLIDPATGRPRSAHAVIASLLTHVRSALQDSGDLQFVEETLDEILAYGTGADRQRFLLAATSDPSAVVSAALERTHDNGLVLTRQRA